MTRKSLLYILSPLLVCSCSVFHRAEQPSANASQGLPLFPTDDVQFETSLSGHWYIRTVAGEKVAAPLEDDAEAPYIEFVPTEARFYGSNGCNIINGTYQVGDAQALQFNNIATTMRLCPGNDLELPIARALDATRSFSVTSDNGAKILALHNADKLTVMTLRCSDIDYINGPWQVTKIYSDRVTNTDCRLIFDVNEGRINGDTGCNMLMGELRRERNEAQSLSFSGLATTRRACPDLKLEQSLLIALEEVTNVRHGQGNSIELLNSQGVPIIHLTQIPKSALRQD